MDVVADDSYEEVEAMPGIHLAQLAASEHMSIQHLRMEPGTRVPSHTHDNEQVGFVYQGTCTFELAEGESVTLGPGESYAIASNEAHAAANTGDTELLALDIFNPPRLNPNWLE